MELKELLPPDVRRKAYIVFAIVGALLTATGVGFAAAGVVAPAALAVAVAVYGSLGTAFGFVAGSNVVAPEAAPAEPRRVLVEDVDEIPGEPVNLDESTADSTNLS